MQKALIVVTVLAAAAVHAAQAQAFCKDLECPKFTVLKRVGEAELRRYDQASWVSTKSDGQRGSGFMTLFRYIQGANAANQQIKMTAPVLNRVTGAGGDVTMSFFQPASVAKAAPKPTEAGVTMETTPSMDVWVLSFGGWPSTEAAMQQRDKLVAILAAAGEKYDASGAFWWAGFDAPTTLFNRHNEVWVLASPTPAAAAGAAAAAKKPAATAPAAKPVAAAASSTGRRLLAA